MRAEREHLPDPRAQGDHPLNRDGGVIPLPDAAHRPGPWQEFLDKFLGIGTPSQGVDFGHVPGTQVVENEAQAVLGDGDRLVAPVTVYGAGTQETLRP